MSARDANPARGPIDDAAIDWALRMAEPDADWDAFTAWLEADPARADQYDRACLALEVAAQEVGALPTPAVDDGRASPILPLRPPVRRRRWIGGAMAAALVGTIGTAVWHERDRSYEIATAPGEQRAVQLADGSSIALSGGSRIRLDPDRPRAATLTAGQALFRVRHDAAAPFSVQVGNLALTDIGTVFDVNILGSRTSVAVAEGAVLVDPQGAKVRLDPGQSVTVEDGAIRRGEQDARSIGLWRDGRLTYDGATMAQVAEDLSRQLGLRITASPAVAGRIFNGTLETATFRKDPTILAELLGLTVRRGDGGWMLDQRR